ncbi:MAG: hypothetical protein P8J17_14345 [Halioglobus sp.]|nr:hypothetical protein [Halioglobus sp.]
MATDSFTTQTNQNVWRNLAYGTAGIIIAFNSAVAAPLLNTLRQGAEFFVAHCVTSATMVPNDLIHKELLLHRFLSNFPA